MLRLLVISCIASVFGVSAALVSAQETTNVLNRRQALEQTLTVLDAEIKKQEEVLKNQQGRSVSLERDLSIINANIAKAKLSIKARDLTIERLSEEIKDKSATINTLSIKLSRERDSLGQIFRKTHQIESFSLPEVILSKNNLSSFFADLDSFDDIKLSLQKSFVEIEEVKSKTTEEKNILEDKRDEEFNLKRIQELEKKKIEEQELEKKTILKLSRGLEVEYQKVLKNKELNAAQIRAELFTLRGTAAIPFEKAYEYAVLAARKTGVRPALILGIIAEESNLGENLGTGSWRIDMKAPRDTEPFIDLTRRLGLNPDEIPVSKKPWYGFGGAMGPAQFIPSTWVLYEERIADLTGHRPPNPWDPHDAFVAAAILLKDNGADKKNFSAERLATLRYLAGWKNASKRAYAFYGDEVMVLAEKYQKQIDILQNSQ